MASHFALITLCAFVLQVSSQLECPSTPAGPVYELEPSTLSDTVHLLRTDSAEEARNTALCHVACINYVFADGSNGTNGTNETASGSSGGLLEPNMISRILQLNCKELKQYLDCRSGCIAAAMGDTNCVDTCSGRCQGICSFRECFGFDGNSCGAQCNANDCSVGCDQHSINQFTDTLAQPTDPPSLIQQDDMEEVYDVIIPSELEAFASEYPSLVFRIETQPGQFTYQWMVNIDTNFPDATITDYILDLVSFTGHTISVSFAYAILNGFSEYSEAIILGGLEVDLVSPSDIVHRMVTNNSDEARTAALCHVMCLDFIFEGGNGTNGTIDGNFTNDSNNENMTEGDLVLGCNQFRQYVDCRTGCIRQSTGEGDCQTLCSERCQDICRFRECFGLDGNRCGVDCNSLECGDGCMLYSMSENMPLMPSPMNSPQLTRDRQNKYNFSLPDELENYENPSVVFHIETENGLVYYQWMVEVETNFVTATVFNDIKLDLSSYPGQRLNIAYAFATPDAGFTSYSESTEVVVPAQCVVREITTDQIEIVSAERDTRAGFFNHRVLNVTWCPSSCTEEVSHYHITRRGLDDNSCGGTVELDTKLNDATTSSALVYSIEDGSPNLPCTAEVQVSTVLSDGSVVEGDTRTRILTRGTEDDFDDITVECPLLYYDSSLMKYRVNLTFIAPFSQATLSHIQTFFYRGDVFRLLNPTNPNDITLIEAGQDDARINVTIDQTVYNFPVTIDPLTELENFYKLSIQVVWMSPAGPAISDSCNIFDAIAPPPLPIQYINITEVNTQRVLPSINNLNFVDVTFFISFNWLEPELQFSGDNITYYEVYIGRRVLEQDESTTTQEFDETEGSLTILFPGIPRGLTFIDAFLQIRSFQYDDIPSDWSTAEPVEIIVLQVNDVRNFEVELTGVNVECDGDQIYLILDANANWDDALDDEANEALLQYVLTVGDVSTTYDDNILSVSLTNERFPLSDNFTLDVVFSIIARKTLKGEELESLVPDTEIRMFQPLPFPEDINITSINPRLVGAGSSYTLSVSMTIDWQNPLTEMTITDYEIRFTTDNSTLCSFDAFNDHSEERMITANNMTQFNTSISEQISVASPQLFVQMRSIVEGDIMLLPQWSDPILVSLDVLTPPNITNSQLLSLQLTTNSLIDFLMETSIELSWTEPEGGSEGLLFYEVWIGSIALEEYEESERLGEIIQVPINTVNTDSTIADNTTTINTTDSPLLITQVEVLSAEFLSESDAGIIYVQIRSVSLNGIPKWSTPAVAHRALIVPPPVDITVVIIETNFDFDKKILDVEAEVSWMIPPLIDEEEEEVTEDPTPPGDVSSVTPAVPMATPFPSPSPDLPPDLPPRRRRQTDNHGSGMGPSGSRMIDDRPDPEPLGDVTAILVYMGPKQLDTFDSRPSENVVEFKPEDVNGVLKMEYSFDDSKDDFQLYVQMQIVTEGGIPTWSDPESIVIPPETGASSNNNSDPPTLPIVLGVVCAFVVALIAAIFIVVCCIYNNKRKYRIIGDDSGALETYGHGGGLTEIYSGKGPILDEWEISTDDVIVDELLGEGVFGEVYKGVIRGPLENPKISAVLRQTIGVPVAIKLLKSSSAGKEKAGFLAEIDMMKKIAEGYNTHIVNMVGCVTLQEPLCLITEFVPFGDLLSYLKYQRKKEVIYFFYFL